MAATFYVIVTAAWAQKLNVTFRDKLSNGCYLLAAKDIIGQPGATLFERSKSVDGAIVSEGEALLIKNGKTPVPIDNSPKEPDETEEREHPEEENDEKTIVEPANEEEETA